uniref:Uncharacterized protein n=1 Tax=Lygus hesperus TaxID=30085 RepID=A0A146M520_LYGHE
MEGTTKVQISCLVFTLILIGGFVDVNGQFLNGISSPASSLLNGPSRILDHITPIRNLPFQSPYPNQNFNSYGYPAYRASADRIPSGCTCHLQANRNADLPPLMNAFVRNPAGQIYGNNHQQFLRESQPSVDMGYLDYSGYS